MASASQLIDDLVTRVAAHAQLPAGSAAAHEASTRATEARAALFRRVAENAAEVSRLRVSLQQLRDLIDGAMT